ncbi:MAG: OsmC family protein [Ectothiorhodospiraceae bacterium]|nr:OsmC family protein [Ectothiorhodospiraceae bacterium]
MVSRHRHQYTVRIQWTGNRGSGTSGYREYDRAHTITAGGKPPLAGSADPAFLGDASRYNPEDLLVSSLSACHMLWYLHLCAEAGIRVVDYVDDAQGVMVQDADGGGRFQRVVLRPRVVVADMAHHQQARQLHERAHQLCFIANSVNFPVVCEPEILRDAGTGNGGSS